MSMTTRTAVSFNLAPLAQYEVGERKGDVEDMCTGSGVNLKGLGIRSALHYPFPFHETTLGTESERAIIP